MTIYELRPWWWEGGRIALKGWNSYYRWVEFKKPRYNDEPGEWYDQNGDVWDFNQKHMANENWEKVVREDEKRKKVQK